MAGLDPGAGAVISAVVNFGVIAAFCRVNDTYFNNFPATPLTPDTIGLSLIREPISAPALLIGVTILVDTSLLLALTLYAPVPSVMATKAVHQFGWVNAAIAGLLVPILMAALAAGVIVGGLARA